MAIPRRSLITLLVSLVAGSALLAQSQQPEEIPLQFRVASLSGPIQAEYDDGENLVPIVAGMGSFSRLYDTDSRQVSFFRRATSTDPAIPFIKEKVAQFTLPAGKGPFLVFLKENGGALLYDTAIFDGSIEAHPPHTYRIFNFGKRDLAIQLAQKNLMLKPGEHGFVDYPDTRKVWLKVAADSPETGWLLVTSSPHVVGQNTRTTILLTDMPPSPRDPNPKGVAVRKVRERIDINEEGIARVQ